METVILWAFYYYIKYPDFEPPDELISVICNNYEILSDSAIDYIIDNLRCIESIYIDDLIILRDFLCGIMLSRLDSKSIVIKNKYMI